MKELIRAHEVASAFYRHQLHIYRKGWAARQLVGRQLGAVLASDSKWSVGYAPARWARLVDHLRATGFDDDTMLAAGLAKPLRSGYLVDRFHDRLTFVAHDIDLRPVGFVARARAAHPKYVNSPRTQIYTKGRSLVGIDAQLDQLSSGAVPVMVEGPTDAIAISLLNGPWAGISPCGTAITRHQAAIVKRHAVTDTVIVMLDADLAGRNAAVRSVDVLSRYFGSVLVAELPDGRDPASLFAAYPDLLRASLQSPRLGIEFAIDVELARWDKVLDHLSGQVGALRAVAPLVVKLPPDRVAGQVARLSQRLGLEERVVSWELVAAVSRRANTGASDRDLEVDPDLDSRSP
ncbi:toprim domain-containing protein [Kribbella sp. CA-294648]|uniref:toprim domain-containing protein n=1 Tax=Kribbella sp. CA-294648 TaxID=3239948 RepID=UPI003D94B3BC